MAMTSGDRYGGGSYSYTTYVKYELSALTKSIFDLLQKGTTEGDLWKIMGGASEAAVRQFQKDLDVIKDQDATRNDAELKNILAALNEMASAQTEGRKPGPKLLAQLFERLQSGITAQEISSMLADAPTEALQGLPDAFKGFTGKVGAENPSDSEQLNQVAALVSGLASQILSVRSAATLRNGSPPKTTLGFRPAEQVAQTRRNKDPKATATLARKSPPQKELAQPQRNGVWGWVNRIVGR